MNIACMPVFPAELTTADSLSLVAQWESIISFIDGLHMDA